LLRAINYIYGLFVCAVNKPVIVVERCVVILGVTGTPDTIASQLF